MEKTAKEHSKQLGDCKREINKLGEIQTQHIERFEDLKQKTDSMKMKVEEHGKEIKEFKEKQQSRCEKGNMGYILMGQQPNKKKR